METAKGYFEETEPVDSNSVVKNYNDKKGFVGIMVLGIVLVGATLLVAIIYGMATAMFNIIDLISK